MTNLERLKMEIRDIDIKEEEMIVYLMESDLTHSDEYDAKSNSNKKAIYKTALSILESIANSPKMMKNYKVGQNITVTHFATNLEKRIDALRKKILAMRNDELVSENDASFVYMFNK